jgi:choline dehydrogenase-like flavoprotein
MGTDSNRSVVDPCGRAHDVSKLFFVDGSSFVTSARQQPTATIQALAYGPCNTSCGKPEQASWAR